MTVSPAPFSGELALVLGDLGAHVGGTEKVTLNLAEAFLQRGIRVTLYIARWDGRFGEAVPEGVTVVDCKVRGGRFGRLASSVVYGIRLRWIWRQSPPEVVLGNILFTNWILACVSQTLARRPCTILVEHNQWNNAAIRTSPLPWYEAWLRQKFMRWADAVVGPSLGMARALDKELRFPEGVVLVAPNAVVSPNLVDRSREPIPHQEWFDGDVPTLVAVGRLVPQKNITLLLEAIASINSCVRLAIVGDGEERTSLEQLVCDLGISSRVLFTGFVANPYSYIARASALILSSRWETLPTVLIEAMALGIPCISTDCDFGPREILDGGRLGILTVPSDAEEMARAIQRTIMQPVAASEALKDQAAQYSYNSAVDRYLNIIQGLTRR